MSRVGHLMTRVGHLMTRVGHLMTRVGHLMTRVGHLMTHVGHLTPDPTTNAPPADERRPDDVGGFRVVGAPPVKFMHLRRILRLQISKIIE